MILKSLITALLVLVSSSDVAGARRGRHARSGKASNHDDTLTKLALMEARIGRIEQTLKSIKAEEVKEASVRDGSIREEFKEVVDN